MNVLWSFGAGIGAGIGGGYGSSGCGADGTINIGSNAKVTASSGATTGAINNNSGTANVLNFRLSTPVRYGAVSDRIDLWEGWVEACQNGEPASVLLYLDGYGRGDGAFELICDGSEVYELLKYDNKGGAPTIHHSDHIFMNDFEFVFAPGIEGMNSNNILFYRSIDEESIEYDTEKLPTLGSISPQQAIEIAEMQLPEYNRRLISAEQPIPHSISVVGAQLLYGKSLYILESESESVATYTERWHGIIAINADGGNQMLMTGGMDYSLPLTFDSKMVKVQGKETSIVPYRDQRTW